MPASSILPNCVIQNFFTDFAEMDGSRDSGSKRLIVKIDDELENKFEKAERVAIKPDPERISVASAPQPATEYLETEQCENEWGEENAVEINPESVSLGLSIPLHLRGQVAALAVVAVLGLLTVSCFTVYALASWTGFLPVGAVGVVGELGDNGTAGVKGPPGDLGPRGRMGAQGEQGALGEPGAPGYFETPIGPIPST